MLRTSLSVGDSRSQPEWLTNNEKEVLIMIIESIVVIAVIVLVVCVVAGWCLPYDSEESGAAGLGGLCSAILLLLIALCYFPPEQYVAKVIRSGIIAKEQRKETAELLMWQYELMAMSNFMHERKGKKTNLSDWQAKWHADYEAGYAEIVSREVK